MKPNREEMDKSCYNEESADYTHMDAGGYIVDSGDSYCYVWICCVSVVLENEGVRDLHMLNATMRRMQRVPVMMDVLRISIFRWLFLRRWGISRGIRSCSDSAHSAFVFVHRGDLVTTASGTRISVSVSASGNAKASLLMAERDSEDLCDRTE
jgi:hypothetical protein